MGKRLTELQFDMLLLLARHNDWELYGYQFMETLNRGSGTIYPNLDIFEGEGWIETRLESASSEALKRGQQWQCRLLPKGKAVLRDELCRRREKYGLSPSLEGILEKLEDVPRDVLRSLEPMSENIQEAVEK